MFCKLWKTLSLCGLAALCLTAAPLASAHAAGDAPVFYDETPVDAHSKSVTNHVDGYRLTVPDTMAVDMGISCVRTVLSDQTDTIEIYAQPLDENLSFETYTDYGNRFIEDDPIYTKHDEGDITLAGFDAHVLEYSRPALKKVQNDKNFYASVDVRIADDRALTFLFKSTQSFDRRGGKYYLQVLDTLALQPQLAQAVNRRTETLRNPWWNVETRTLYDTYFGAESGLTWGVFTNPYPLHDSKPMAQIEQALDYKFRFVLHYTSLSKSNLDDVRRVLNNAARSGRTVELTLQTPLIKNGNYLLDTLDGKYDEYLNSYARIVADSRQPVLFRLCNEMNGDWCLYSAYHNGKDTELFKAFYRYVHDVFEKNGALGNTIWVWNPNGRSYPNFRWNDALCYYPGDRYVDVVGLTAYNTGTYYPDEQWQSFPELYDGLYREYDAQYAQPLMITEFACSSVGGDKAAWVREMLATIGSYDRLRIAIWWNGCDYDAQGNISRPYFIDDNPGVMEAFRDYFARQSSQAGGR